MGFTSSKGSDNAVFAPAKSWTLLEIRCPIGCFETTTVNQFKTQLGTTINLKAAQNQSSPVDMLECRDPAWKGKWEQRKFVISIDEQRMITLEEDWALAVYYAL